MSTDTGRAHPSDRATRPTDQAPAGLGDTASVPCAFTPGPWRTGPAHVVAQQTTDGQGRRVTRFVAEAVLSAPFVDGEREANARLIAAAPELYEALEWAVNEFDGKTRYSSAEQLANCIEKCRDALAKARGQ